MDEADGTVADATLLEGDSGSANMAFTLLPLLTVGAIEAVHHHGSSAQQAMYLPKLAFVYLSWTQPSNFLVTCAAVAAEQFGYGFGFTAYMLYMMMAAEGENKTAHYAICTGFIPSRTSNMATPAPPQATAMKSLKARTCGRLRISSRVISVRS